MTSGPYQGSDASMRAVGRPLGLGIFGCGGILPASRTGLSKAQSLVRVVRIAISELASAEAAAAWYGAVEEYLVSDDIPGHAALRRMIDTPIGIGGKVYTIYQFRDSLVQNAVDYLQSNQGSVRPAERLHRR